TGRAILDGASHHRLVLAVEGADEGDDVGGTDLVHQHVAGADGGQRGQRRLDLGGGGGDRQGRVGRLTIEGQGECTLGRVHRHLLHFLDLGVGGGAGADEGGGVIGVG